MKKYPAFDDSLPHGSTKRCPACLVPAMAWELVTAVTETALEGDEDAVRVLPAVIAHALQQEGRAAA